MEMGIYEYNRFVNKTMNDNLQAMIDLRLRGCNNKQIAAWLNETFGMHTSNTSVAKFFTKNGVTAIKSRKRYCDLCADRYKCNGVCEYDDAQIDEFERIKDFKPVHENIAEE